MITEHDTCTVFLVLAASPFSKNSCLDPVFYCNVLKRPYFLHIAMLFMCFVGNSIDPFWVVLYNPNCRSV